MADDERRRAQAPHGIRLRNLHAEGTKDVAFYLYGWVSGVRMDRISVRGTGAGPGLYLDTGSRDNEIHGSCFRGTAREGVAIDSSAFNLISRSRFESNEEGGIFLYRNAQDRAWNPDDGVDHGQVHAARAQHSEGNRIEDNLFLHERKAVWIASRAARNYAGSDMWQDPVVYDAWSGLSHQVYRRDYAEANVVTKNEFIDTKVHALIIEDDHNVVTENYFESAESGDVGIFFGSRPRQWTGDPICGNVISRNAFHVNVATNLSNAYCALGSLVTEKVKRENGRDIPYDAGLSACGELPRELHPALIGLTLF